MKFRGNTCGLESFFEKKERNLKSERCFAAFLYVPIYIIVMWLVVIACVFAGNYIDSFKGCDVPVINNKTEYVRIPVKSVINPEAAVVANDGRVNINAADEKVFEQLPGIGATKAKNIVDTRTQMGGFRSVEDLLNVRGIGEKTIEGLVDCVTVLN